MARFFSLFSSSSGNCTYIGTAKEGILIDAGRNAKQIELSLMHMQVDPASIQAIFITHEHTDHISGLRVFASRYGIDVYASNGTLCELDCAGHLNGRFNAYIMGTGCVETGSLKVCAFNTSHDSRESLGFCIETPDKRKVTVATDTGIITEEIESALMGSDLVLLESNHDLNMLETGPYPYVLKRRIKSDKGHLSNDACALMLQKLVNAGTTRIVLGHLSKENNLPRLAYAASKTALCEVGAKEGCDYLLSVAPPNTMEKMIIF
ncbi:MAG: MBL fold metallo-hydrolase [Oscillospiraceae bacterium]|nr:MBL fold metallo-hydrolase [Oscillospiraceae bacterium]